MIAPRAVILFALFACSEPTDPLDDAGMLPPDSGEIRDANVPDIGPPDSGWRPKGKDTCGDGVLEQGEACFGRTVIPEPYVNSFPFEVEDRNRDGRDDMIGVGFGGEETGSLDGLGVFITDRSNAGRRGRQRMCRRSFAPTSIRTARARSWF
jgi:hypothetical protein